FGRGLCLAPFASCAVFPSAILRAAGRNDLLERLIEGERFAVAYEEPQGTTTRAQYHNGAYVISGRKIRTPVPSGDAGFIVSAKADDGICLFLVTHGTRGMRRVDFVAEDGTNVTELTLDGVASDAPLGTLEHLRIGLEHAVAAVCAEAVGVMSAMFEMTLRYLKERTQFGVPIGSFQALQHRMADMFTELELARSMAYLAAMTVDGEKDAAARAKAISGAKVQVAKSGRFVGQNAIQLHGAIAMTEEYRLGAYFKRMTVLERLYGDLDYHLARFCHPERSEAESRDSLRREITLQPI
ncbi:MAG: hypothetical protein JO349_01945, partial [Candidatus Eremiobacteraeota bacterium]|nr:hypothetical protein [Candidatus Eremiobacteraeota bacterium]